MRPNYGKGKWEVNGPRVLAWMRAEVPKRSSLRGLAEDCARALKLPVNGLRLTDWLGDTKRDEWAEVKRMLGNGKAPVSTGVGVSCSLDEFAAEERRSVCPVCALPADVRAVLATAGDKGHKVAFQVKWLKVKCGVGGVGVAELAAHRNGRHEA